MAERIGLGRIDLDAIVRGEDGGVQPWPPSLRGITWNITPINASLNLVHEQIEFFRRGLHAQAEQKAIYRIIHPGMTKNPEPRNANFAELTGLAIAVRHHLSDPSIISEVNDFVERSIVERIEESVGYLGYLGTHYVVDSPST